MPAGAAGSLATRRERRMVDMFTSSRRECDSENAISRQGNGEEDADDSLAARRGPLNMSKQLVAPMLIPHPPLTVCVSRCTANAVSRSLMNGVMPGSTLRYDTSYLFAIANECALRGPEALNNENNSPRTQRSRRTLAKATSAKLDTIARQSQCCAAPDKKAISRISMD
ncbi:hypothetical protein PYCCODRAFT_1299577 [Trametes coccinea BRFM310]|uniref:Uncharacterized protein n=1 Tax=Trametes coccinea (strain BRFM310) TaxID=1353009 RepID=A0A1Y2IX25_TRAC3|nr:hypothetical protein PYCCODRAFT_1299577 [Trametes coccinea BRFM310]